MLNLAFNFYSPHSRAFLFGVFVVEMGSCLLITQRYCMDNLKKMLEDFYPYAKERLGFENNAKIVFVEDEGNAGDPLGKTAFYEPSGHTISVFITDRHPKDIMRSVSHELVHHAQNCRGDLTSTSPNLGEEGYAQKDKHLRELEREAYEVGNMNFRDWEDSIKQNIAIYENEDKKMSNKDRRNHRLNAHLMEKWGYKPKKQLDEKAESRAQQKFMAAALDCQKNDYQDCGGEEVKQAALDMSKQDLEDYASTSTEDLPEKVAEQHDELEGVLDFDLDPYADDDELAGYYDEFPELRNSDQADDLPDDLENEFLAMLDAEEEEAEEVEEAVAEVSAMATGGCAGASAAKEDDDSEIEDAFGDDESPLLSMEEEEERHPFDNLATQTQQKFSVNEARTNRNRLLAEQVMKAWFKK